MPLHEHWREYSEKEIYDIQKQNCIRNNCQYLKPIGPEIKEDDEKSKRLYCDYLCMTGKLRGCLPEECRHWKDPAVPKNKKNIFKDFLQSNRKIDYGAER